MQIKYERSGGFAGMIVAAVINVEDLPEEQRESLFELLDEADFHELPARILPASPGADQFTYIIEVDGKKGHHSVMTTDSAMPEKLRPLVDLLGQLARSSRGGMPRAR